MWINQLIIVNKKAAWIYYKKLKYSTLVVFKPITKNHATVQIYKAFSERNDFGNLFFYVLVYKIRTDSCNNITFLYYFFACPHACSGTGKKVIKPACVTKTSAGRKGHPGECFSPFSENILKFMQSNPDTA